MKALIVFGGWEGHDPVNIAHFIADVLRKEKFDVELSDSLEVLADAARLKSMNLVVPHWTMGQISGEQSRTLADAVAGGVGLAGIHGGMGDAFRGDTTFQMMVGGQFVGHPGNIKDYRVNIVDHADAATEGIADFAVRSEQYYMHVDPSNHVLATTLFSEFNGATIPVVWKRSWGKGRVFYSSLGHSLADVQLAPALEILRRGMLWAARAV